GVPSTAIRVLPERNVNTAEEVRTVARGLDRVGGDRVILVTSSYHARRVKLLWRKLVGEHPEAIVRYTPDDGFEAGRWWRARIPSEIRTRVRERRWSHTRRRALRFSPWLMLKMTSSSRLDIPVLLKILLM
ncbi:MAG: hypothetical protein E6J89_17210, partial [Deltaproteobacteria bacterium]